MQFFLGWTGGHGKGENSVSGGFGGGGASRGLYSGAGGGFSGGGTTSYRANKGGVGLVFVIQVWLNIAEKLQVATRTRMVWL